MAGTEGRDMEAETKLEATGLQRLQRPQKPQRQIASLLAPHGSLNLLMAGTEGGT